MLAGRDDDGDSRRGSLNHRPGDAPPPGCTTSEAYGVGHVDQTSEEVGNRYQTLCGAFRGSPCTPCRPWDRERYLHSKVT